MMIGKADDNLECAGILKDCELYDGVANRTYFAAYHAGWHFLVHRRRAVPATSRGTYWPHDRVSDELAEAGMNPFPRWEEAWDILWNQRVKADYSADTIQQGNVETLLEYAHQIVRWVKDGG